MAEINIQTAEIIKLANDTENNNTSLFKTLVQANSEFEKICDNVGCSQLSEATVGLTNAINNVVKKLHEILPNLVTFISSQTGSYLEVSDNASTEIDNLIRGMDAAMGLTNDPKVDPNTVK